jgi:hypothetical protein
LDLSDCNGLRRRSAWVCTRAFVFELILEAATGGLRAERGASSDDDEDDDEDDCKTSSSSRSLELRRTSSSSALLSSFWDVKSLNYLYLVVILTDPDSESP